MSAPRFQIWYCCVELNRGSKSYFANQLGEFQDIDPLVLAWRNQIPDDPGFRSAVIDHPWNRWPGIPFGWRLERERIRLESLVTANPFASRGKERQRLLQIARTDPPLLIYAQTGFMALRLLKVKRTLRVPMVVHFHGLDINSDDRLHQKEMTAALPEIDHVIVVANWMRGWFLERGYPEERISVVPMGVQTADATLSKVALPTKPRFIFVGRFVPYKGVDRTITAFHKLHQQVGDARLALVGDGPQRTELEALVHRLGVVGEVDFLGMLPLDQTLAEVSNSTALVHHALNEPDGPEAFPTVVSEAMAAGRPVVGTRCGGIPDQIVDGDTGFLIEQNDTNAMAAAMQALAADPDLCSRMGHQGRRRAVERLDVAVLARETEQILLRIAG